LISTCEGLKAIKDIKIGDFVITPLGKRKIIWSGKTAEVDELVEITTSKGNKLICTKYHKVFVEGKGFIRCDALRYNDVLSSLHHKGLWKIRHRLFGMGSNTGFKESFGYPKTSAGLCSMGTFTDGMVFTSGAVALKDSIPLAHYIGQYGHFIKGKFLKVITCTTKIMMEKTTTSPISNCIVPQSTQSIMDDTIHGSEAKEILNNCEKITRKQKHGISPKREENGIVSMEKILGKIERLQLNLASFARSLMRHLFLTDRNSVPGPVNKDITGNTISEKNRVYALFVDRLSRFMNILRRERVVSLVPLQCQTTQSVYDLTVESDGCYYAQGFLVSNSDAFRYLAITESSFRPDRGVDDNDYQKMMGLWGPKV
jgi:hypothetical protein